MRTETLPVIFNANVIVMGLLAGVVLVIALTGVNVPLLSKLRVSLIVFLALGMAWNFSPSSSRPSRSWRASAMCRSYGGSTPSTTQHPARRPSSRMPFEAPVLGVFACRAPMRPNPVGLTTARVLHVDRDAGRVEIADIDAYDGTPVLDLKAYMPFCDRVRSVRVPDWAAGWPQWMPEDGLGLEE